MQQTILNKEIFKALSSDTRIDILKYLGKRRMTLSEISEKLNMSLSTIKEHLDTLSSVKLIVKIDEGRKWKYYELTEKGKGIVSPIQINISIFLGVSIVAMIVSSYFLTNSLLPVQGDMFLMASQEAVLGENPRVELLVEQTIPYLEIIVFAGSMILFGFSLGYYFSNRGRGYGD